jgi:hypothetical protein
MAYVIEYRGFVSEIDFWEKAILKGASIAKPTMTAKSTGIDCLRPDRTVELECFSELAAASS